MVTLNICVPWQSRGQFRRRLLYVRISFSIRQMVYPIRDIASIYDISTNTVRLCLKKYAQGGTDSALFDEQRDGCPVEITDDAVAWMIDIACQRPADLGYSQELWT